MKKVYYPFLAGHNKNTESQMFIKIEPANRRYLLDSVIVNVDDRSKSFPGPVNELKKSKTIEVLKVRGGELLSKKGKELVQASKGICEIQLNRITQSFHPMSLDGVAPKDAKIGDQYIYHIKQLDAQRRLVGGLTVIFEKRAKK